VANLISGIPMITVHKLGSFLREEHRTRSSFQALAPRPVVFGSQFDLSEFVVHLLVFPWIKKDFTSTFKKEKIFN